MFCYIYFYVYIVFALDSSLHRKVTLLSCFNLPFKKMIFKLDYNQIKMLILIFGFAVFSLFCRHGRRI